MHLQNVAAPTGGLDLSNLTNLGLATVLENIMPRLIPAVRAAPTAASIILSLASFGACYAQQVIRDDLTIKTCGGIQLENLAINVDCPESSDQIAAYNAASNKINKNINATMADVCDVKYARLPSGSLNVETLQAAVSIYNSKVEQIEKLSKICAPDSEVLDALREQEDSLELIDQRLKGIYVLLTETALAKNVMQTFTAFSEMALFAQSVPSPIISSNLHEVALDVGQDIVDPLAHAAADHLSGQSIPDYNIMTLQKLRLIYGNIGK